MFAVHNVSSPPGMKHFSRNDPVNLALLAGNAIAKMGNRISLSPVNIAVMPKIDVKIDRFV
jgi:hypothetical protein